MNTDNEEQLKYKKLCELTKGDFKAFLYDCDGTLTDNMQAHKDSYVKVAANAGINIDPEIIDEFAGLPIPEVVEKINERYNSSFNPAEFEELKSNLFYDEFIDKTEPIHFVVNHLKAQAEKFKIAVVSGGSRRVVQKILEVLGIASLVDVLVCSGETLRGKPFPDPFLYAAEKLDVEPRYCIVFEDAAAGVQGAEAAGMKSIRIDKIN